MTALGHSADVANILKFTALLRSFAGVDLDWELVQPITPATALLLVTAKTPYSISLDHYKQLTAHVKVSQFSFENDVVHILLWRPSWCVENVVPSAPPFAFGRYRTVDFELSNATLTEPERTMGRKIVRLLCNLTPIQTLPVVFVEGATEAAPNPRLVFGNFKMLDMSVLLALDKLMRITVADMRVCMKHEDVFEVIIALNRMYAEPITGKKRGGVGSYVRRMVARVK
jgi:hypothetical protein